MTSSMPRSTSGSSLNSHSRSASMPSSSASPSSSSHHHPPPSWSTGNDSFDSDLENVPPPLPVSAALSYQRPYTSSFKPTPPSLDSSSPSSSSLLSSAHSSSSAVTPPSSDSNYYFSAAATKKEVSTFSLYPKPRQPLTATTSLGPSGGSTAERSTSASELGLGRSRAFGRVVSVPYASLGGTALGGERRAGPGEDGWAAGGTETMSTRPPYDLSPSTSTHDTSPSSSSLPRSSSRPPLQSTSSFDKSTSATTSNFTSRTANTSTTTTTPGPTSRFRIPLSETRPTRQPLGMPVRMSKEKQAEMREQAEREDRERLAKEAEEAGRVKAAALEHPRISPAASLSMLSSSSQAAHPPPATSSSEFNHDDSLSLTNRASSSSSAARSTSHLQPSSLSSSSSHSHSSSFPSSLRNAVPNHPTAIVEETETDYSSSTPSSSSSSSSPQTQTQTVVPSSSLQHQRHSPPSRSPLPSVAQLQHQPPSPSSSSSSHHLPSESSDPHRQKSRHRYSPSTPAASPPSDPPYSRHLSASSSSIDHHENVGGHSRATSSHGYRPPTPPRSKPPSVGNDVLPIAPSPEPYSSYSLQHEPHRPPPPPPLSQPQSHQQYQPQPPPIQDPRYASTNGYPLQPQQQQQEHQQPIYPGEQQQQYQQQTVRPMPGGPQGGHYEPLTGSTMGSSMMQQYPQQQQQYLQQQQQLLPPSPTDKDTIIVKGVPYQKLCLVGRGGSSRVFKAIDKNHTVVAIKKVSLHKLDNEAIKSYENEVALLRSLRGNDKVIQMYEDETVLNERGRKLPKTLYVVMEYGEVDFSRLLEEQKGKRLNMNFVGLFWLQMLECVQVCHDRGIIHTDLKPANFVLVRGALKIIDFGISHAIEEHTVHARRDAQIGTLNYMSPESVIRSEAGQQMALGRPTDVWALGCILYQMIYGRLPFGEFKDHPSKLRAITNPDYQIKYPPTSTPTIGYAPPDAPPPPFDPELTSPVDSSAIAAMKRCFKFGEKERPTIAQLLEDPFLKPWLKKEKIPTPLETIPPGSTAISLEHLKELVLHAQSNPDASEDSKLRRLFESLQRIQVDWAEKQTAAASSPRS